MKRNPARLTVLITFMLIFICSCSDRAMAIQFHYYTDKVAILMYHHFDDKETSETITGQHFEQQIRYLQDQGYNFISLEQLTAFMENRGDIPANAVVLTFDDGYESTYEHAYPFLKENQIPATFFLIAGHIGAESGEIPKLAWEEIEEMQKSGYDFQSHSYDLHQYVTSSSLGHKGNALTNSQYLPHLRRYENNEEYTRRVYEDFLTARTTLEKSLHKHVDYLSPPYGAQNSLVETMAEKAGYKYLLTTTPGMVDKTTQPTAFKRIDAGQAGMDGESLHQLIVKYARAYRTPAILPPERNN